MLTKEVYGEQITTSIIGDKYEEVEVVDALDWRQQGSSSSSSGSDNDDNYSETEPSMDPGNALKDAMKNSK